MQEPQLAPAAPRPPAQPRPFIVDASAVPRSGEEVLALRDKLEDLRSTLQDAAARRRTVSEQLRDTDSRARPGLEERLAVLDARIIGIEEEITATAAALQSAPSHALTEARSFDPVPAPDIPDEVIPIVAILSVFVLGPIALAISRFLWKRSTAPAKVVTDNSTQQRLEQLQQAVDTIAIEVERISEGQRFVTKILHDRSLASGEAVKR